MKKTAGALAAKDDPECEETVKECLRGSALIPKQVQEEEELSHERQLKKTTLGFCV